jgi:hypothetical protein
MVHLASKPAGMHLFGEQAAYRSERTPIDLWLLHYRGREHQHRLRSEQFRFMSNGKTIQRERRDVSGRLQHEDSPDERLRCTCEPIESLPFSLTPHRERANVTRRETARVMLLDARLLTLRLTMILQVRALI